MSCKAVNGIKIPSGTVGLPETLFHRDNVMIRGGGGGGVPCRNQT